MAMEMELARGNVRVLIDFESLRAQLDVVQSLLTTRIPQIYTVRIQADTTQFIQQVNAASSATQALANQAAQAASAMNSVRGGGSMMHIPGGRGGQVLTDPWAWMQQPGAFAQPHVRGGGSMAGFSGVGNFGGWSAATMAAYGGGVPTQFNPSSATGQFGTAWGWRGMQVPNLAPVGRGFAVGALSQINPWLGAAAWTGNVGLGVGMAGAQFGGFALGQSMEREWNEAILARISGARGQQLDTLTGGIRGIGMRVPIGQEAVYGLAAGSARAGIADPSQLAAFTEGMAKLSLILDDTPPEELATSMARLLDLFDIAPDQIEKVGGALAALDQSSTATATGILQTAQRLAGFASASGITLPQTLAISTLLGQTGIAPERGATAVQRIMTRMMVDENNLFGNMMGLSPQSFAERMQQDPFGGFKGLVSKIGELPQGTAQTRAIFQDLDLHNIRDIEALQKFASELDKLPGLLRKAASSADALNSAAAGMSDTMRGRAIMLGNWASQTAAAGGDMFWGSVGWAGDRWNDVGNMMMGGINSFANVLANPFMGRSAAEIEAENRQPLPRNVVHQQRKATRKEFDWAYEMVFGKRKANPEFVPFDLADVFHDDRRREAAALSAKIAISNAITGPTVANVGNALGLAGAVGGIMAGLPGLAMAPLGGALAAATRFAAPFQRERREVPFMAGGMMPIDDYMRMSTNQAINSRQVIEDWQKTNSQEQLATQKAMLDELKKIGEKALGVKVGK